MKLTKEILANAFALTAGIIWVICTLGVAILPDLSFAISKWWMHGLNMSTMGSWQVTITGFLAGGLVLVAFAWLTGYIFGWSLEYFGKKR